MKGNIAFVTGGASGIGRATLRAFLSAGVPVVIVDINEAGLAGMLTHDDYPPQGSLADAGAMEYRLADALERPPARRLDDKEVISQTNGISHVG